MSYILDALKKSDQERQQHNGPGLQTIHKPQGRPQKRSVILGGVMTGVVVSAFGLGLWFYLSSSTSVSIKVEPLSKTGPVSTSEKSMATAEPATAALYQY